MVPEPRAKIRALEPDDRDAVLTLLAQSGGAPEFVRLDLLGTGRHFGHFHEDTLVTMAGTHLIDTEQKIAAIGSVNTLPEYRGRGLARQVVAGLTHRLREEVDVIALNVGRDNTPARNLYEGLGFLPLMEYEEAELVRR
jgi:predicted GNAT family acetyltransferase